MAADQARLQRYQELRGAGSSTTAAQAWRIIKEEERAAQEEERAAQERKEAAAAEEREEGKKANLFGKLFKGMGRGIGPAAGYLGTRAKAATGVVAGAGAAAGASAMRSFSSPAFMLYVGGALAFVLLQVFPHNTLRLVLGTVFLFWSAAAVLEGRGIIISILFFGWYIWLGIDNITSLYYSLPIILLVGLAVHGLLGKLGKSGSFAEGAKGELVAGLIPPLIFLLDIGVLELLSGPPVNLTVTTTLQNIMLYLPWWGFFGLIMCLKERNYNPLVTIGSILGVIYVLSLFLVVPAVSQGQELGIAGPEQLLKARQEVQERLSKGENPFISYWRCALSGGDSDLNECVQRRQQESKIQDICKRIEKLEEGTREFEECVEEQRQRLLDPAGQVTGVVDPTIRQPTTVELKLDRRSFPQEYDPQLAFPADLKIQNPRRQQITAEVSCSFTVGATVLLGRVEPAESITFSDPSISTSYLCFAPEGAALQEEKFTIEYRAVLRNLNTQSRLERAFIGDKTPEEKENLWQNEISRIITVVPSQAPADLAKINFWIGHAAEEVIIEDKPYRSIAVRANVENTGRGEIAAIHNYDLTMEQGYLVASNPACLAGAILDIPKNTKILPLPKCLVIDYPAELKEPGERKWIPKTFIASLDYDYSITAAETLNFAPQRPS